MTKPLSADLRSRVVAAVDAGLSGRQAAARFGVRISSAIRWTSWVRTMGDFRPLRVGLRRQTHSRTNLSIARGPRTVFISIAVIGHNARHLLALISAAGAAGVALCRCF